MVQPRQADVAFGPKHVAVEVRDPLPAARRHIEITDGGLDARRNAVPVELRIAVDEVRGRAVAELAVQAGLLELVVERVGLAQIVRVAELADEIGGAQQRALLCNLLVLRRNGNREARALDRARDASGVQKLDWLDA